jgi:hypothetical protein
MVKKENSVTLSLPKGGTRHGSYFGKLSMTAHHDISFFPPPSSSSTIFHMGIEDMTSSPKMNIELLLQIIDEREWEDMEQFEYNGTSFLLLFPDSTEESDGHAIAVYHASSYIDGFDVYILSSLSDDEKKRCLFHEVLEASLRAQGYDLNESHEIALAEEEVVYGLRP